MCYERSMEVRKSSTIDQVSDFALVFFLSFPRFSGRIFEKQSPQGSINSSRPSVAIFRFIETTHKPIQETIHVRAYGLLTSPSGSREISIASDEATFLHGEIYICTVYMYTYTLHSCTLDRVLRNT